MAPFASSRAQSFPFQLYYIHPSTVYYDEDFERYYYARQHLFRSPPTSDRFAPRMSVSENFTISVMVSTQRGEVHLDNTVQSATKTYHLIAQRKAQRLGFQVDTSAFPPLSSSAPPDAIGKIVLTWCHYNTAATKTESFFVVPECPGRRDAVLSKDAPMKRVATHQEALPTVLEPENPHHQARAKENEARQIDQVTKAKQEMKKGFDQRNGDRGQGQGQGQLASKKSSRTSR